MNRRDRRRRRFPRFILLLIILLAVVLVIFAAVRLFADGKKNDGASAGGTGTAVEGVTETAGTSAPAVPSESAGMTGTQTGSSADAGAADEAAAETGPAASASSGTADRSAISATEASAGEEAGDRTATELETGREYLAGLDRRTPVEMEVLIDEARKQYEEVRQLKEYAEKREEYREMLGGDAVWDSFHDYVFLGDSRVVGFSAYSFLPEDRVLAETGDTINAITDRLDQIRSLSPDSVFISYGINDIGTGLWPTAEGYAESLAEKLDTLQEALPDAEIYVNSILPATEEAIAYGPAWAGLPEYSEAVRSMCEEKGFGFIDNTSLVEEHGDLYAGDGVHLEPDFYRYWAENQLLAVYDREHGMLTFAENGAGK